MTILVGRPLDWAITATAGSGFLLFGYDQGVISGLLTGTAFTNTFPEIDTTDGGNGSSSLQGTVVAIYEIGCFFGAIFCLIFGEYFGRRKCIMIGCVVLSIGAALQASAYGIPQMIVGRIVAGLGNGMNTSTIPVWHSELMKASNRGRGLAIELAITIFGVMLSYWVDYGMSYVETEAQFRFPIAFQIFFAILTFIGIILLPESPRWLVNHDLHEEAREVLWAVRRDAKSISKQDDTVSCAIAEIQHAINEEREAANTSSFKAMWKNGEQKFLYRTMLGIGGQFMQQLSGINLITYVSPLNRSVNIANLKRLTTSCTISRHSAYFLSSLIPIWIIDRLGRRKLMMFAASGQAVCMAVLAGTVSTGKSGPGIVAIVMLFLFNFFFAVGLLAIPWLLPAEYAPLAIRTRAAALATASNWIFTFLVVEITPISISSIGWKTYIYFGVFNAFFVPLIYFFYPETRLLSLEQIDKLFTGPKVLLHWDHSMGVPGEASERSTGGKSGEIESNEKYEAEVHMRE
ncbi:Sugar transporter STL1 [Fusarium oxysporum f. sp. cubense race 1]|uniref:Sugar transporter STL1 n=1 Tax=Fusarium oxysporum f. sp. cubense (strain race 1) TaxID=1229664 RepID=N4V1T4_FUSC1|nr:Sugar transporter STL1 [Fusarium oxysporum f. sp. cubense race 1]